MDAVKYYYESDDNLLKPDEEQGYAMITPLSACDMQKITDHLIGESFKSGRKPKIEMGKKSLELNRKHCPKVFNVTNSFTGEVYGELGIEELYIRAEFKDLYEELSNAIGNINILKEGIKKK
jgi:hypothetical protein